MTSAQAKEWIKNAKISITVWNQHYERYIGEEGAVYVNLEQNEIRTAFSSDEFDGALPTLIEEMRKNGLLR